MAHSPTQSLAKRPSLLVPGFLVLGLVGVFGFRFTGAESVDLAVQSFFWRGDHWLIDPKQPLGLWLAYDGPKALIILFALWLIAVAIFPHLGPTTMGRRRALYLLACLAVVPLVCTQLRAATHMATPRELVMYQGKYAHLLLFEAKPESYPSHAFPAGHASGGFALLSLAFAWTSLRARRIGIIIGLTLGTWMGLYQIARGEHFLSHTLVTAALAWFICVMLARAMRPADLTS